MNRQELLLKEKNELTKDKERTTPEKVFIPEVDIFEKQDLLLIQANMPGTTKNTVEVNLHKNTLTIKGNIKPQEYEGLRPIYSEYNVGNYERTFEIGSQIQQDKIEATVNNGVLSLVLPKTEKAQPRSIQVN